MTAFDFEGGRAGAAWLGELLGAEVASVSQREASETMLSEFAALEIAYAEGGDASLPRALLMKLNRGRFFAAGRREIAFYRMAASASAELPLVRCFGDAQSSERETCCLLLDDLRATHGPPSMPWPTPPDGPQRRAAIAALAQVHAAWWDETRALDAAAQPARWIDEWVQAARAGFDGFCEAAGERLSSAQRATYQRLFESLHEAIVEPATPLTVLHGDAHYWNFLFPRDEHDEHEGHDEGDAGGALIIDWQLWRVGRGAFDLAYMIALHGEADHRAEVEGEALMFYAAELAKHGVHYRWPDLRRDYALGAALDLLYPVRLCALGVPEAVWAPHLRRGFAAFDDLGCASVLGI